MKFLHTSDWHVGKPLRSKKRDEEYVAALAEVLDIARREQVDCLLVAGDVFDSAMPPPEAERIVFDFFRELAGARIPAVVIGGNHDHPRRLNAFARVLDLVDIHVRGEPVTAEEGAIVEIASRDGAEVAVVAALPWVSERKVRLWEGLLAEGQHFEDYAEGVAQMLSHLSRGFRTDTLNVLVSHVMMHGALVGGEGSGERPLHVGQAYAVKPQRLPEEAHFIALGHLHKPQPILRDRAYYSGSLLQLDFGEAGQQKSVNLVDAAPRRPARVETVPLASGRPLRDVRGSLEELPALANDAADAHLRVFVQVDRPLPGLAEQVRELLPNAVAIIPQYRESEEAEKRPDIGRLSPTEMFVTYYEGLHGGQPPEALMNLFARLQQEVSSEAD